MKECDKIISEELANENYNMLEKKLNDLVETYMIDKSCDIPDLPIEFIKILESLKKTGTKKEFHEFMKFKDNEIPIESVDFSIFHPQDIGKIKDKDINFTFQMKDFDYKLLERFNKIERNDVYDIGFLLKQAGFTDIIERDNGKYDATLKDKIYRGIKIKDIQDVKILDTENNIDMDNGSKELNKMLVKMETMSTDEYTEMFNSLDKTHNEKIIFLDDWLESALKKVDKNGYILLDNNRIIHKDVLIKSVKEILGEGVMDFKE